MSSAGSQGREGNLEEDCLRHSSRWRHWRSRRRIGRPAALRRRGRLAEVPPVRRRLVEVGRRTSATRICASPCSGTAPAPRSPRPTNIQQAVDCALLNDVRPILAIYPGEAAPDRVGRRRRRRRSPASSRRSAQSFPGVEELHHRQRAERQPLLAAAVRRRPGRGGQGLRAHARQVVRRAEGRPSRRVVWGPAISSRGNDNANAASNPSHSPVRFIKDMGDAYRASGRTTPIFDEFNMHPYPPVQDTDPFTKAFQWPQAGAANLDRIKQALWDAFNGTAQPIPAEQAGGRTTQSASRRASANQGLPLNLDEVGEQTVVMASPTPARTPARRRTSQPISEQQQAQAYTDLMEIAACDPDVKSLLFFPLIDEQPIRQRLPVGSALRRPGAQGVVRGVKSKIATLPGPVPGRGRRASRRRGRTPRPSSARRRASAGPGRAAGSQPAAHPRARRYFAFSFTATEDTTWTVRLHKLRDEDAPARRARRPPRPPARPTPTSSRWSKLPAKAAEGRLVRLHAPADRQP